jgi:hypothetical protein
MSIQNPANPIERLSEHRRPLIKLSTHPSPLSALPRKHKRDLATITSDTPHNPIRILTTRKPLKTRNQLTPISRDDDRAITMPPAMQSKRPTDIPQPNTWTIDQKRTQPLSLDTQRLRRSPRHHKRQPPTIKHTTPTTNTRPNTRISLDDTRLLKNEMSISTRDTERRNTRTPNTTLRHRPLHRLPQ